MNVTIDRRRLIVLTTACLMPGGFAFALPQVKVSKDPNCGCCTGWVKHLERSGFSVQVSETNDVETIKKQLGVPAELSSCHTAEVDGYVIEGHVPAHAIRRLLVERPSARGLAVPGMPVGSPGMEGGKPEAYEVRLFAADGTSTPYGRYLGGAPAR